MADILHLRCRHCNKPAPDKHNAYCQSCNLHLFYLAMPLLLGMLMTGRNSRRLVPDIVPLDAMGNSQRKAYAHSRYILD